MQIHTWLSLLLVSINGEKNLWSHLILWVRYNNNSGYSISTINVPIYFRSHPLVRGQEYKFKSISFRKASMRLRASLTNLSLTTTKYATIITLELIFYTNSNPDVAFRFFWSSDIFFDNTVTKIVFYLHSQVSQVFDKISCEIGGLTWTILTKRTKNKSWINFGLKKLDSIMIRIR